MRFMLRLLILFCRGPPSGKRSSSPDATRCRTVVKERLSNLAACRALYSPAGMCSVSLAISYLLEVFNAVSVGLHFIAQARKKAPGCFCLCESLCGCHAFWVMFAGVKSLSALVVARRFSRVRM